MKVNWFYSSLMALTIILLAIDLIYGILLGSFSSLLRCTGHLALLIILIRGHSEVKFSIALWAWVMLIIIPSIYPVIAGMFLISNYVEGIEIKKLIRDLVWMGLGTLILILNRHNKFSN